MTASGSVIAPEGCFWIGSEHPFDLSEVYLNFRVDVDLAAAPASAVLHLSADSRYRLWVNGVFIGRGPERSWPSSMAVDAQDVAACLRAGRNQIAVQVYCPGYSHFAYVHRAACGLIGWLEVDGQVVMTSDMGWRVRRDASWQAQVPRVSIYGTGVELRDMAKAMDWQTVEVAGWAPARILQPPEGPIWNRLRPRATPVLGEQMRDLGLPWQTRHGPAVATTADPHTDLRAAFAACKPGPVPQMIASGKTAIWVFDLGHSQACVAGCQITANGGETLTVSYAEKLRHGDILLPDPDTYCRMRPTDRFTLRPGRQEVEGFTLRGARYVIFRLDTVSEVTPDPKFHVRLPQYPLAERVLPDLGDDTLNAVAQMCRRTTLACLQDGFVDSIWRESSQWLGDAVAQAFALQAISDDLRPLRIAIDMAAEGVAVDGILPSILPGDVPSYVVTDYNFSWVELLDMLARHPDTDTTLHRHWLVLERMLDRFHADLGPDGLIRSQPGRRLFLDWSVMDRGEPNLTYNLRYLHALQLAGGLAGRLDMDAKVWRAQAQQIAAAIRKSCRAGNGWQESPDGAPACQLALSLLIMTDVVTGAEAEVLAERIVARSLNLDDAFGPGKLTLASPFMHHYVFQALDHLGRRNAIRAIIAARWGRWAMAGEPTTWENWAIDFPDGSACHGFSAHPLGWLIR